MPAALLRTAARLVSSGVWTGVRHATLGSSRPGWSWLTETMLRFIRSTMDTAPHNGLGLRRHVEQATVPCLVRHRVRHRDVTVAGLRGRWFEPRRGRHDGVLLYLHGGGYVFGSLRSHEDIITRLALASGARTLAVEYRLAPEHPYPAALNDCVAAYRWLLGEGVDPRRLAVAGESAGGALTLGTLMTARDAGAPLPAAGVGISPWADLTMGCQSLATNEPYDFADRAFAARCAAAYLAGADPRSPLASPLFGDLRGLPPLLLQVGTAELLLDEVTLLAQRAEAAGVDVTLEAWDDMFHIWHFAALVLRQGAAAIEHVGRYVRHHTSA
ncbi:MAG: alpha/beta hydrolase [bacterium]